MTDRLVPLLAILWLSTASLASATTITSTPGGGPWHAPTTWQGGAVPGAGDDVVVLGPVTVAGLAACASLAVEPSGAVSAAAVAPPRTLEVAGAVTNAGTLAGGVPHTLDLRVGGDIHNAGTWDVAATTLTGQASRTLSQEPGTTLATDLLFDATASGDAVATTPLTVGGNIDTVGGRLVLGPDCPLTLVAGYFRGDLQAGGNELRFESFSYLLQCTIDDVVFVGEADVSFDVTITTRLVVMDSLRNGGAGGGGDVTVQGDLINHGLITNDQYSFPVRVWGDLENDGVISNPLLLFMGAGVEHRLRMGPDAVISAAVFLPEFQAATLVAETPVHFANDLGLGVGTLVLEPGASLRFSDFGGLGSGTVLAGGNTITVADNASVNQVQIDQGVVDDLLVVHGEIAFTGGLLVTGALTGWPWAPADLLVDGTLRNEGTIGDGAHPVRIRALGDVVNMGAMTSARVEMAGPVDQAVATGPQGIAVPEFVLVSGLPGTGHQWYRDGAPLAGETGPDLLLNTVGAADHGAYHCEAGGVVSRTIVIAADVDVTDVPAPGDVLLAQNHPNPFNPATTIAFSLERAARVELVVHDAAGRQVARLVDGVRGAGRHEVRWQPRRLPSGTYVYRLRTADGVQTRKCVLLK